MILSKHDNDGNSEHRIYRWRRFADRAVDPDSYNADGYGPCQGNTFGDPCNHGKPRPAHWRRVDGSAVCSWHKGGTSARNEGGSMPLNPKGNQQQFVYLFGSAGHHGIWKIGRSLSVTRRAATLDLEVLAVWPVPISPLGYPAGLTNSLEHWLRLLFAAETGGQIVHGEFLISDLDPEAATMAFWRSATVASDWLSAHQSGASGLTDPKLNAAAEALRAACAQSKTAIAPYA